MIQVICFNLYGLVSSQLRQLDTHKVQTVDWEVVISGKHGSTK